MTPRDLTLLLPTFKRPAFVRRALDYYASQNLAARIIVADSSPAAQLRKGAAIVERLKPRLCVEHIAYAPEISPWEKLKDLLSKVDTRFVVVGADDDLFCVAGLRRAVDFLAAHDGYSVAHGDAFAFFLRKSDAVHGYIHSVAPYPQASVEYSSGIARLIVYLCPYSTIWYSVHRTSHLRENWVLTVGQGFDHLFMELILASLDVIHGRVKRLDGLYMVRQSHSAKDYHVASKWHQGPSWDSQHALFCDIVGTRLARVERISLDEGRRYAEYALALYLHSAAYESVPPTPLADVPAVTPDISPAQPAPRIHAFGTGFSKPLALRAAALARRSIRVPYLARALGPWARYAEDFAPIYDAVLGPSLMFRMLG